MAVKPLLQAGLRKVIGSSEDTKVWSGPWIPTLPLRPDLSTRAPANQELRVAYLLSPQPKTLNMITLRNYFIAEDISLNCSIKTKFCRVKEDYCWCHTSWGIYSLKTHYNLAMELKQGT